MATATATTHDLELTATLSGFWFAECSCGWFTQREYIDDARRDWGEHVDRLSRRR